MADYPQFIGAYYKSFASKAEVQTTKNLFLETIESGEGRGQYAMYMRAGLKIFRDNSAVGLSCRGLLELNDILWSVQGPTIFGMTPGGGSFAALGPIVNDNLPASIDASDASLFVVSGGTLYRLNAGVLTTPATPFVPATVVVIQGLIVCLEVGTNRFWYSTDDGQTWPGANFQVAEAYPNALVNEVVDHQELWLFGNRRTQIFVVGVDPNAPFDPVTSGVIEVGLGAKAAICKLDNSIFWLGQNKDGVLMFWRANGYSPLRVSNHAVENTWRGYPTFSDAVVGTYQQNGHQCIRLTFPSANNGLGATWNYDASMPPQLAWTETPWWNPALNRYERHRGAFYVSAFGKLLVGDYANGFIWEMSPDFFSDFGYPLRWERRAPHSVANGKWVKYNRFGVFMQTGVGTTTPVWLNDHSQNPAMFANSLAALVTANTITGLQSAAMQNIYSYLPYNQDLPLPPPAVMTPLGFYDYGSQPQVGFRWSNNGGSTFNAYRYRSMGQAGEYSIRLYWTRLGKSRDRVHELSGMSPVQTAIAQAALDAEELLT